jgi:anaerobic magnesium-protoporphyrin IX monomethyl ester cyclase
LHSLILDYKQYSRQIISKYSEIKEQNMKVALVGPELEENLGLRYLHASILKAGHEARIIEFHAPEQIETVVSEIISWGAEIVGLSMVFTARAREFLHLTDRLRDRNFTGRIIAGGHFASFHAPELLINYPAIDFIVHGEGELTLVDLLQNLNSPHRVEGIGFRNKNGGMFTTEPRPNPADLDILPFPTRTPPFYTYLGIPIANILGSRGCFGHCSFCSITAWYRKNTGPRFRQRSVCSVVFEMAQLYHEHHVRIFNFHDDTFFLHNEQANLERFEDLERTLQSRGMTDIALQVKARTDAITPAVLQVLRRIGLFRVFLGVENHSAEGLKSLGKGTTVDQNRATLQMLRAEKMHITYNLLMFGPDTTIGQLEENIGCIREFADIPINFGRAEVYSGTPLEQTLCNAGRLKGDWLGYNYDIADRRVQNIFEVFRAVFTERNFQTGGLNFLGMKLDYYYQVLRHFFPSRADDMLFYRKKKLIEKLNHSNADILERICRDVGYDPKENRHLAGCLLGQRRQTDVSLQKAFSACIRDIEQRPFRKKSIYATLPHKAAAVSAAAALLLSVEQCTKNEENPMKDPVTSNHRNDTLVQFDATEISYIEQRIFSLYKLAIDSAGRATGFINQSLQCNLCLDSNGNVDSCNIIAPSRDSAPAFFTALDSLSRTWNFPDITRPGKCGIVMIVAKPDTDWHISETIGYPVDTTPPISMPVEYDSADIKLINNKINTDYSSSLNSLFIQYGFQNRTAAITLYLDSSGTVTGCTIDSWTGTSFGELAAALRQMALTWKFPGVSREGFCTVTEGGYRFDPIIFEIIAFPQDSIQGPGD